MTQSKKIPGIKRAGLVTLIACLVLISVLLPERTIQAQSSPQAIISPSSKDIHIGDTTEMDLNVAAGVDINAFDLTITYDPAIVSLDSWSTGDYLSNLAMVYKTEEFGRLRIVFTQLATAGANGEGNLVKFNFKGLAVGSSAIAIESIVFSNSASEAITPSVQNGSINVAQVIVIPTMTFTVTSTATQTQTATPTHTATQTATQTTTKTTQPTLTKTQVPVSTTATKTPTRTPGIVIRATSTPIVGSTVIPSVTSSTVITLTPLPIPLTGKDTNPTSTEITSTEAGTGSLTPTATQSAGGPLKLPNNFGFLNQFLCFISIILLILLIILLVLILKSKKKK